MVCSFLRLVLFDTRQKVWTVRSRKKCCLFLTVAACLFNTLLPASVLCFLFGFVWVDSGSGQIICLATQCKWLMKVYFSSCRFFLFETWILKNDNLLIHFDLYAPEINPFSPGILWFKKNMNFLLSCVNSLMTDRLLSITSKRQRCVYRSLPQTQKQNLFQSL